MVKCSDELQQIVDRGEILTMKLCGAEVTVVRIGSQGRESERLGVERLIRHRFGLEAILSHHQSGAPYVDGTDRSLSITHGAGYTALVVADRAIGIDVEGPRSQLERVASRFLSEDERHHITGLRQLQWAWTVKEAVYKAALTPGLPLKAIRVVSESEASVSFGKYVTVFSLDSIALKDAILTVAKPKSVIQVLE